MKENKTRTLILILILVVVILSGVILYTLLIRPALNGFVIAGQNQGYEYAILTIAQQAATCQPVPLNIGNNQTMELLWTRCLQQ